jgi:tetratricopeptide (TPR) repeat protein
LLDEQGRIVGIVNRLGPPPKGGVRTTAQAVLCTDALALKVDRPVPLSSWGGVDNDASAEKFRESFAIARGITYSDPAQALPYLRTALEVHPTDLLANRFLVYALEGLGRRDEATGVLRKLAEAHPESPQPMRQLGDMFLRLQKYPEAVAAYRESLKSQPMAATWYWLGNAQWKSRDVEAAADSFKQAVNLEPRHPASWDSLIATEMELARYGDVGVVVQNRLKINPKDPEMLTTLAEVESQAGNAAGYRDALARLREVNPFLANREELRESARRK